jgi:hypothetical protein
MNFGDALNLLKRGGKVCRLGWNGKDMFLIFIKGTDWKVSTIREQTQFLRSILPNLDINKDAPRFLPWIGIKTADNCFVPWLASQPDILADDWEVIKEVSSISQA